MNLQSPDFQLLGTEDGLDADQIIPDPWLSSQTISDDQLESLIQASEDRIMVYIKKEIKELEFRLQSQIAEEQMKRRYLKVSFLEHLQNFKSLKKFLT